jgi:hypothetical protein
LVDIAADNGQSARTCPRERAALVTLRIVGERTRDEDRTPGPGTARIVFSAARLDTALTGTLPCVTCGYELKGLSIRNVCPECGTAVRATILYQVDPYAEEFRPIVHRRTVAAGLVLWSASALAAAVACWMLRASDVLYVWGISGGALHRASWVVLAAAMLSGIGSLGLIRPVPGTPFKHILQALVGSATYVPLIWALWRMHLELDPIRSAPYFAGSPQTDRILLRFVASASIIIILLGVRPNARDLVKRCMVMRTGRVDRQTILGMAAVVGLTMAGDGLRLAGPSATWADPQIMDLAGTVVIAIGSAMLTLGLVGALLDSWRIARAVLIPAPSLRHVIGDEAAAASSPGPTGGGG